MTEKKGGLRRIEPKTKLQEKVEKLCYEQNRQVVFMPRKKSYDLIETLTYEGFRNTLIYSHTSLKDASLEEVYEYMITTPNKNRVLKKKKKN